MSAMKSSTIFASLSLACALAVVSPAFPHGDEIETAGGHQGPVKLTPAQQRKLDLRLATAALRPMAETLRLNGEVRTQPGREASVGTRISGQVTALYAKLGEQVRSGQRLARVQSRLVGNPPPSVEIAAPMAGTIDALDVSVGQAVEPSTSLFRISDRSQINVVARVYEEDLGKVKPGQSAVVRTLAYPDKSFAGTVSLIGPALDPLSRTVEVWIALANPESLLKPNLFARVGIVLRQGDAILAIPTSAIIEANGEKFVFVRKNGEFARTEIETGSSDDQFTEVSEGLVPGDEVVTQGNREVYTLWLTGGVLQQEDD
jgi:multidrug efflux pump subunit AcrA (membrane-fusion protein)